MSPEEGASHGGDHGLLGVRGEGGPGGVHGAQGVHHDGHLHKRERGMGERMSCPWRPARSVHHDGHLLRGEGPRRHAAVLLQAAGGSRGMDGKARNRSTGGPGGNEVRATKRSEKEWKEGCLVVRTLPARYVSSRRLGPSARPSRPARISRARSVPAGRLAGGTAP